MFVIIIGYSRVYRIIYGINAPPYGGRGIRRGREGFAKKGRVYSPNQDAVLLSESCSPPTSTLQIGATFKEKAPVDSCVHVFTVNEKLRSLI